MGDVGDCTASLAGCSSGSASASSRLAGRRGECTGGPVPITKPQLDIYPTINKRFDQPLLDNVGLEREWTSNTVKFLQGRKTIHE